MKKFAEYLDISGRSQKEFAQAIGVSEPLVSALKLGHRTPSLRVAAAIERETRGLIPINTWVQCHSSTDNTIKEVS